MSGDERRTQQEYPEARKGLRFSLRFLFLLTLALSCWLAFLKFYPHFALFGMSLFLAGYSALLVVRAFKGQKSRPKRLASFSFAVLAWLLFYVLSIGPIVFMLDRGLKIEREILEFVYAPVIWLHDETALEEPLEDYVEGWERALKTNS